MTRDLAVMTVILAVSIEALVLHGIFRFLICFVVCCIAFRLRFFQRFVS